MYPGTELYLRRTFLNFVKENLNAKPKPQVCQALLNPVQARFFYSKGLNKMKAYGAAFRELGNPTDVLQIRELELGEFTDTSVYAKVIGSNINPSDLSFIRGIYAITPNFNGNDFVVPGFDGAVEILRTGKQVSGLKAGDLAILSIKDGNGFTEGLWKSHVLLPQENFIRLSTKNINLALSLKVNPMTSYYLIENFVNLKPGDTILITGANSSCGKLLIQFAKIKGVNVVGVVRDRNDFESLATSLKNLGASAIVRPDELKNLDIPRVTNSRTPPILALDCVSGELGTEVIKKLSYGGTYVNYGAMSYKPLNVPVGCMIFKNVSIKGFWLSNPEVKLSKEDYEKVANLIESKNITLPDNTSIHVPNDSTKGMKILSDVINTIKDGKHGKKYVLVFDDVINDYYSDIILNPKL